MKPIRTLAASLIAGALIATPAHAGLFAKKPEDVAAEAERGNMQAVTVWVDVTWGFRNQGAANSLNRAHAAFASHGYRVQDVQPYIENGDLQGFFVTYQKP